MIKADFRRQRIHRPKRPLLLAACAGAVALVLAVALAGCGTEGVTTTTAGSPDESTTTSTIAGLPGELSTVPTTGSIGQGDTSTSLASVEETTTTAVPDTTGSTTTTEKLSTAEQRLEDGRIKAMGFIKKVWEQGGKRYISIDYAELLTGKAAVDAAVAAGEIQAGEDLPNDYFIRNTSSEKRQFEVSPSVAITTSSWQGKMDNPITWNVFKSLWSATPPDQEAGLLRDSPWWIERDGMTVVKIDEQFLP